MTDIKFHEGDTVQINSLYAGDKYRGLYFTVDAVPGGSRKKLRVIPFGGGPSVSGDPSLFLAPDSPRWVGPAEPSAPATPPIFPGSVVEVHGHDELFVVAAVPVSGRLTFHRLGGGDKVLKAPRSLIKRVIPLDKITVSD